MKIIRIYLILTFIMFLIIVTNCLLKMKKTNTQTTWVYESDRSFGIEVSSDIYIDNLPAGRYTKSGIRILPKNEQ